MPSDTKRETILVVDDNTDIRGLAKRILEVAGYTVVTAADGEEGLCFYENYRSSIVLHLTDVVMPKIGGLELADRIRGIDSALPVLFMSGSSGEDYAGWECMAKPFRPADLIETVSRVLHANAQSAHSVS